MTAAPAREQPSSFAAAASFLRISALGVTLVVPFLGAASAATDLPLQWRAITTLVTVAVSFHIFGFVINDLVDLPIDRTAGRESSPLVRGTVRPNVALGVALAQVPIALAVAWWGAGRPGVVALVVAGALGTAYNVWGKRTAVPPMIDLVQGLAWAAFAGFGVAVAGAPGPATGWLLAFLTVYMMLANGVHGAIRDLRNDARHEARTTALFLGARPGPGRTLLLSRRVIAYALILQGLLTGVAVAAALDAGTRSQRLASLGLVSALAVAGFGWLATALRCAEEDRLRSAGIVHLILTFLFPLAFLIPTTPGWLAAVLLACCIVPFLLNGWLGEAVRSA
ncbi:MAG: UbiA prenyltransferase family protein [Micromonosporaceae bacterium]